MLGDVKTIEQSSNRAIEQSSNQAIKMTVLIFEDNLMWSARLVTSLRALGHEPVVMTTVPVTTEAQAAILNLASPAFKDLVPQLKAKGIHTIGHAGHKEKDLLELGKAAGCDRIATNSELTYKIEALLGEVNS